MAGTYLTMTRFLLLGSCLLLVAQPLVSQPKWQTLYREGIESYLDEYWQLCIDKMTAAIDEYREMIDTIIACRRNCSAEANHIQPLQLDISNNQQDIEEIHVYQRLLKRTRCQMICRHKNPNHFLTHLDKDADNFMRELKPYEYLHLCYFQKGMYEEAASAAFTFLQKHPNDALMIKNLKFYTNLPEVDVKFLTNYEAKEYVKWYLQGTDAYHGEDFNKVIKLFEKSLKNYLEAEEDCRAHCEGPFDQGWYPDFVSSISNHFTFCLKCKNKCATKLNNLNGDVHEDLLPSHYHYLQFAYYKVGKLKKACQAVASFLLFYPDDEIMNKNMDFYLQLSDINSDMFVPRPEAVRYVTRKNNEKKLLEYIENEFTFEKTNEINDIKSPLKMEKEELYPNSTLQFN